MVAQSSSRARQRATRRRFLAHGLRKKKDKHRSADLDRAARILTEHMAQAREGRGGSR